MDKCSDREKVFYNWMERDALFASEIRKQCTNIGYKSIVVDGKATVDKILREVCIHFGEDG